MSGGFGVAGVGAGDGVAEVAFDPFEGGVSQPVCGDAKCCDPWVVSADPLPEMAVAASGDWASVSVAKELSVGVVAAVAVCDEGAHECW